MNRRDYLKNLTASPVGLALVAVALALGALVGVRVSPAVGIAAGFCSLFGAFGVLSMTGLGSRLATGELERRTWNAARPFLDVAKDARNRLATLRVPDPEIKSLLELLAARGAAYLSACESARSRDPLAEDALAESVSIADLYLRELDGAATEKRYGLADADPFADARGRVRAALMDKATVIEKATLGLSGGLSPADRMEVKESL